VADHVMDLMCWTPSVAVILLLWNVFSNDKEGRARIWAVTPA